ncbi:GTPase IMAP family member 4-like [Mytilus trossulus]|uniref:GTPase IMAP family member 4-like n=1 Tax=Mytilus trossulus TaxID=6551 RepID=UPI0030066D19
MGNSASCISDTGIEREVRIVMIGKTGSGKSATGNSILQKMAFASASSSSYCTKHCRQGENIYDTGHREYHLIVVDTLGVIDTGMETVDVTKEVVKCIGITSPGPHAIIFVVPLAVRFTQEEEASALHFINVFGGKLMGYMVIFFSHGDSIKKEDSIEQRIADSSQSLQKLVQKCEKRFVVFNNKLTSKNQKKKQLNTLIEIIDKMIEKNYHPFYTDEMYKKAEEELQKRMKELRKANKKMTAVDRRTTDRNAVEDDGGVLSMIGNGIYSFGQGMVTSAVQATGISALFNGLTSWLGKKK